MTPQRIQRKRTKGWRMPEGAVYVGRPTYWGNPWRVHQSYERRGEITYMTPEIAVERFRRYVNETCVGDDARKALRGKSLACWCPLDQPCHADVLLELANA